MADRGWYLGCVPTSLEFFQLYSFVMSIPQGGFVQTLKLFLSTYNGLVMLLSAEDMLVNETVSHYYHRIYMTVKEAENK